MTRPLGAREYWDTDDPSWSGVLSARYVLAGLIVGLVLFLIASTIRRA